MTAKLLSHQVIAWNEEMAKKYDPNAYHTQSILPIRMIERYRSRKIIQFLHTQSAETILEVGCGAGNLGALLTKGTYLGLDLSSSLLGMASSRRYSVESFFVRGSGEHLPFPNESIEKAFCSEVLEHVVLPEKVVSEVFRVLREEAVFVVSVPNEPFIDSVKDGLFRNPLLRWVNQISGYTMAPRMTDEWHLHSFDALAIRKILLPWFHIDRVRFIPSRSFPIRIVVSCRKRKRLHVSSEKYQTGEQC